MTPKQKYDERKRLKAERLLREEQRHHDARQKDDDMEARFDAMLSAFERIADTMELWADMQTENVKEQAGYGVKRFGGE